MSGAVKWAVGAGAQLERAFHGWAGVAAGGPVVRVPIRQGAGYEFDFADVDALDSAAGSAFAAFDECFGNFKRLELMAALLERGFKLPPFISPQAWVEPEVRVETNAFVGAGASVGHGSRIGYNSALLPGVRLGCGVVLGPSCWLEPGVVVGDGARIGAHCTLRSGVIVAPGVRVGRSCELGWPQRYGQDVAAKTIFDCRYDAPIFTYEG